MDKFSSDLFYDLLLLRSWKAALLCSGFSRTRLHTSKGPSVELSRPGTTKSGERDTGDHRTGRFLSWMVPEQLQPGSGRGHQALKERCV